MKVGNVKAILEMRDFKQLKGIFREHIKSFLNEFLLKGIAMKNSQL